MSVFHALLVASLACVVFAVGSYIAMAAGLLSQQRFPMFYAGGYAGWAVFLFAALFVGMPR